MKRTRKTKTTIEKHEVVLIRSSRQRKQVLCPECSDAVALVTLDEAIRVSGIGSRAIYRLIEEGQIHFAETTDGGALICPATLLGLSSEETRRPIAG